MKMNYFGIVFALLLGSMVSTPATQEERELPETPHPAPVRGPAPDNMPVKGALPGQSGVPKALLGPIAPAGSQPTGALSGRIVFTSGGHGLAWDGASWTTGRGVNWEMVEDYGNVDQMSMFAYYCFNAGATVVAMRPIGNQTNEVVLDNVDPEVTFQGAWADSVFTNYYGNAGDVPYRFTSVAATETATATYVPNIPVAGFYPVYTWVWHSTNRTSQLYRVRHTGGESQVRVPHYLVGGGWVYLGTYYFAAGSDAARGAVVISNLAPSPGVGSAVIADAIRFGNGMGSIARGGGVSGHPREHECARYWIQSSLGRGSPTWIYDDPALIDSDDNVSAPIRMAREMNEEAAGNFYQRIYIGFHSNASGLGTNSSARGDIGLYNNDNLFPGTATSNQFRLAEIIATNVNNALKRITVPPFEVPWLNNRSSLTYARTDFAFGEIRGDRLGYEMDATIIEVAFHDNVSDARLMRDPKVRNWIARASYQAVVHYMHQFDAVPLNFLPEPPRHVRAVATANGIQVRWDAPVAEFSTGTPAGFVVYRSTDGYGFGEPVAVAGGGASMIEFTNVLADTDYYFRVAAVNAGGESFPSETVGCRRASNPAHSRVLFVNGFDRFDRTTNLRQNPTGAYAPPGNSGAMERVIPRSNNSFDYVVPHGKAISAAGLPFDSCSRPSVTNHQVALTNYDIVIWACGQSLTNTFRAPERNVVTAFQNGGGHFFLTGSEVAWDLDRAAGPAAADRAFLNNQLHADLGPDANNNSSNYTFAAVAGTIFEGNSGGAFDDGNQGIYWVKTPDVLVPTGSGATAALVYGGGGGKVAGIQYAGASGGRVVYWGFPFETVTDEAIRADYMADVLRFFARPPRFERVSFGAGPSVRLWLNGDPGEYTLQTSPDLINWAFWTNVQMGLQPIEISDDSFTSAPRRFYRALR